MPGLGRESFGTILGSCWDHFGTILGQFWDYFGNYFGSILGPFWNFFGSILGAGWDHFGAASSSAGLLGTGFWMDTDPGHRLSPTALCNEISGVRKTIHDRVLNPWDLIAEILGGQGLPRNPVRLPVWRKVPETTRSMESMVSER